LPAAIVLQQLAQHARRLRTGRDDQRVSVRAASLRLVSHRAGTSGPRPRCSRDRRNADDGHRGDHSRGEMPTVMSEEISDVPAFACCSVGIGRWFWVAWGSEAEARAFSPALASGYESSADRAEAKVAERFGPRMKRLPGKWASGYKRRGGVAGRTSG